MIWCGIGGEKIRIGFQENTAVINTLLYTVRKGVADFAVFDCDDAIAKLYVRPNCGQWSKISSLRAKQ